MNRRAATKRIMVIDDDVSVRDAFAGALGDVGYEVVTAADGAEGLAKALARPPDLIFLDLRMPGMNGIEVLRLLQAHGGCCTGIPVYIVTAFQREFTAALRQALADGLHFDVADKPLMPEQIQAIARGKLEGAMTW